MQFLYSNDFLFSKRVKFFLVVTLFFSFNACKKKSALVDGANPVPAVTSITPNSCTAGDPSFTMTINGSSFMATSVAKWNGVALPTTYISASKLSVFIADNLITTPGTDSIKVFNPTPGGGTSNALPFYCGTMNSNPSPSILSLSPASVTVGAPSLTLTLTGSNFISSSTIYWNNSALTTTYVSANQITAIINSSLIATAGSANITVINPQPGGGTSNSSVFSISAAGNNPIPTITSIQPTSTTAGSASFLLTVIGANNFMNTSVIQWNGTAITTSFVSASQLTAIINSSLVATAGTANITVLNPAPGGGTSVSVAFSITSQGSTTKRFLFDATKAETAGNADWVIDEDNSPQRVPTPAQSTITSSTAETYWTGALSSWGIALVKLGHFVETLPSSGSISYGNSSNPQDLSNYDVFVIDEPNTKFTTAEKQAILNFINGGGGLFMIADHTQSDRNNDGWDSPDIWNDLMTNNGVVNNPFGFSIDLTNISGTSNNILSGNSSNVILHGSQGNVSQVSFNNGATITLNSNSNATVQGLIWESGYSQTSTHVISASSTYGSGRVYVISDSSPMDDGTGGFGNTLYVDWSLYSHAKLFLNASLWLAKIQ